MSCSFEHLDGAYVLGSLAPSERAGFERHLTGCDDCSRSVRDLAGLPGLLSRVTADVLESPGPVEPVPETLLPSLVAAVGRDRRRRTARLAGLAAAAVAVVAVGTAGLTTMLGDDGPAEPQNLTAETAPPQELTAVGDGSVTGWVSLTPVPWGTRLDLTCAYRATHDYGDEGSGTTYTMVVRTTDGDVEEAATWRGLPGREMHVTGATSADPDEIASVVVRTSDGEPVLRLMP
jgi:hypothetical protein